MDRLTDRPDMTSAVNHGRKASTQQQNKHFFLNMRQGWYIMVSTLCTRSHIVTAMRKIILHIQTK